MHGGMVASAPHNEPTMKTKEGVILGKRTNRGKVGSVRNWLTFCSLTVKNKNHVCRTIWGGNIIYAKADNIVFTMSSFLPPQIRLYWYGMFSALLGVKVYKNSYEWLYFDVLPSIRLHSIFMEDDVVTQGSMLPIRILWKNGISGCWIHIQMI